MTVCVLGIPSQHTACRVEQTHWYCQEWMWGTLSIYFSQLMYRKKSHVPFHHHKRSCHLHLKRSHEMYMLLSRSGVMIWSNSRGKREEVTWDICWTFWEGSILSLWIERGIGSSCSSSEGWSLHALNVCMWKVWLMNTTCNWLERWSCFRRHILLI